MPESIHNAAAGAVRLIYLARLRDAFGCAEESWALGTPPLAVADLLAGLRARSGAWAHELAPERSVRVAVNHALVGPETVLRDGDEVALLPPVTGG